MAHADEISLENYMDKYNAAYVEDLSTWQECVQYIHSCFVNHQGAVIRYYGSGYENITMSDVNKMFTEAMQFDTRTFLNDGAALWGNMKLSHKGLAFSKTYTLLCFSLEYRNTAEELAMVDEELDKIIKELSLAGKSKERKTRSIHDYICNRFDYDKTLRNFTPYNGFIDLVDGKEVMVCQGYSLLAYQLLNKVGVNTNVLVSDSHSWNIVQMEDGKWYHLDITNDDLGVYDKPISYEYYLKSNFPGISYNYLKNSLFYADMDEYNFSQNDHQMSAESYNGCILFGFGVIFIFFIIMNIRGALHKKRKIKSKKLFDLYNSM